MCILSTNQALVLLEQFHTRGEEIHRIILSIVSFSPGWAVCEESFNYTIFHMSILNFCWYY